MNPSPARVYDVCICASAVYSYVGKGHGGQKRAFKVKFLGEGVNDYGGPYRAVFEQVLIGAATHHHMQHAAHHPMQHVVHGRMQRDIDTASLLCIACGH